MFSNTYTEIVKVSSKKWKKISLGIIGAGVFTGAGIGAGWLIHPPQGIQGVQGLKGDDGVNYVITNDYQINTNLITPETCLLIGGIPNINAVAGLTNENLLFERSASSAEESSITKQIREDIISKIRKNKHFYFKVSGIWQYKKQEIYAATQGDISTRFQEDYATLSLPYVQNGVTYKAEFNQPENWNNYFKFSYDATGTKIEILDKLPVEV